MVDIKTNSPIVGETDSHYESRMQMNSSGTGTSTPSSSSDYLTGEADDSSDSKGTIPFSLKSVETMLSLSKDASEEDLQEMVQKCKLMVLESAECSDERKWLVRRLIELRLRAQELRETSDENLFETCVILGHHFVPQKYHITTSGPIYCDHCSGAIWTMLQSWYMCSDCKFSCHWKCLSNVCRICVHVIASEAGGYTHTKDICPEQGLSKQSYRCAECKVRITFTFSKGLSLSCFGSSFKHTESAWVEPRLCDYSGLYYCQRCHWNTAMVIPARVIRNWDMEPRLVSRAAAQLLMLLEDRSVLPLEELNPKLFTLVPDLSLVKRMRGEMQMMKKYLVLCLDACTQGLPWKIGLRTHMIENSGNYSIKDLIDLQSGILLDELRTAYDTMHAHITQQCELIVITETFCRLAMMISVLGTLWCGNGDIAKNKTDLGFLNNTDACCRAHDNCKYDISSGDTMANLDNNGLFTRSACSCDDEFYYCLKNVSTPISKVIGDTYFNILGPQCFQCICPSDGCQIKNNDDCNGQCTKYKWVDNKEF